MTTTLSAGAQGIYDLLLYTPKGLLGPPTGRDPANRLEEAVQAKYRELVAAGLVTETPVEGGSARYTIP